MNPPRAARRSSSAAQASSRRHAHGPRGADGGRPDKLELLPPAALLVVALLLGGSANPVGDMIIDCLAVLLLGLLAIRFTADEWRRSRLGWLMVLATLAIAAIELTPLPYALWRSLPGRALPAVMLDTLGLSGAARPLSLDPNATVSTLLQVLPGLAIFVAVLAAGDRTRRLLTAILIAGACVCVVLGSLQMTGQRQFYLYQQSNFGEVTGLFANHNHAADLLLIGITLLAGRLREVQHDRSGARILIGALMLTLGVTVLLTASRFGIVLLAVDVAALAIFLRAPSSRRDWAPIAIAIAAAIGVVGLLTLNATVGHALDRFNDFSADLRSEIWQRTAVATAAYWPVGSGLGTFVPVYAAVERIDTLPSEIVNHAHNEYLELVCELGLVGAVLIAGYLAGLAMQVARCAGRGAWRAIVPATLGILVLLIHSTVEFPLRNESLMMAFGLLNGLVFCAPRRTSLNNA